jgi:putative transposase
MARHSYCCCWIHLIWATKGRQPSIPPESRKMVSCHLREYAAEKQIPMKINFVNADHVHALIELPTLMSVGEAVKLLKGESSHWINQERLTPFGFAWQTGFGAFSVSYSRIESVCRYIGGQEAHHRRRPFAEELREFVEKCGMQWRETDEGEEGNR